MTPSTATRRWLAPPLVLALVGASLGSFSPARAAAAPSSGIVCTEDHEHGTNPQFTLYATGGYVSVPDGNTIYMWSYTAQGPNAFQLPGPTLCVREGDHVTVTLVNRLDLEPPPVVPERVSILFFGQPNVLADGVPAEPELDGDGHVTSFVPSAPPGGSVVYEFDATEPGTYIYESGTDPAKQVPMGLAGALVIRPSLGDSYAYDDPATQFKPTREVVMLFSEVDPDLHQAVERGEDYRPGDTHNRYWMINGRSFPDTIAPNFAPWLPAQPYSALVHIDPYDPVANPLPALIRYLNVGSLNHPFHPHGNHGRVIARDGRLLKDGEAALSYEKFTVLVGAGQTWDEFFTFTDREHWHPVTNPIPVTIPQLQNLIFKNDATWYSGSPYLGVQDELPVGVTSFNECGEFYHVAHSHALQEAANFDAGFGGMLTLIRIDPPAPNTCSPHP
jgi:FtsP/CotA-like multicopper oxidase with cupredoxin domain